VYILEKNLATVKIKNQSIILVHVKFPQGRSSRCGFTVGLASFPSCEERHCCNISIYLMKNKNYISISFIFMLCFTEVRRGGSFSDTGGWVLSCAEQTGA